MLSFQIAASCYHLLRLLGSVETDTLAHALEQILLRFVILGEIPGTPIRIPFEAFVVVSIALPLYFAVRSLAPHHPLAYLRKLQHWQLH